MKVSYMSDLHLEFGPLYHELEGDVLILAGDINIKARTDWINEAAECFGHVIYVLGNHEFYRGDLQATEQKLRDNLASNVHLLQNSSVEINGHWFHGATLWTELNNNPISANIVRNSMNDFRLIRCDDYANPFTIDRWLAEHRKSVDYLCDRIALGDIVITHHAPHPNSIAEYYRSENNYHINGGYYSNLEDLILTYGPRYWIHGHMHHSNDYMIGDTRVLSNPRGYVNHERENYHFDINATFEI